jgi:hypothetical protein
MERAEAFYHIKRIAGLCQGLRVPIAFPHDGLAHEKGSGEQLANIYKRLGAPMMGTHAQNHGTGAFHTEPAIEEMCGYMKLGKFAIGSHMSDLAEEILSYHRDEDYKIVRMRDDLISAVRYAFMMRRNGKRLDECESYGKAPGTGDFPMLSRERSREPQTAKGLHFDVFTGGEM